jgi:hypothetical protein
LYSLHKERKILDTIHRDEDQLIEKAISGDKEAFGHLYDHYFIQISKYLLSRTDTWEDAGDMTETHLSLFSFPYEYEHDYEELWEGEKNDNGNNSENLEGGNSGREIKIKTIKIIKSCC